MDINWIEDFLALAGEQSFSRAANKRSSSQSAFSRRIQSLEAWLGVELFDRSFHPPKLTAAGKAFLGHARIFVQQMYQTRNLLQEEQHGADQTIEFAVTHTLSLTFFPGWFAELQRQLGKTTAHVANMNMVGSVNALVTGKADFLMCYHDPTLSIPALLDSDLYQNIILGKEFIQPYSACDKDGKPIYQLSSELDQPLPFYASDTFFAHLLNLLLLNVRPPYYFDQYFENQMSETLKALVVSGNGLAWLPEKYVTKELREQTIAAAGPDNWKTELEIRIFRSTINRSPVIARLWDILQERAKCA